MWPSFLQKLLEVYAQSKYRSKLISPSMPWPTVQDLNSPSEHWKCSWWHWRYSVTAWSLVKILRANPCTHLMVSDARLPLHVYQWTWWNSKVPLPSLFSNALFEMPDRLAPWINLWTILSEVKCWTTCSISKWKPQKIDSDLTRCLDNLILCFFMIS